MTQPGSPTARTDKARSLRTALAIGCGGLLVMAAVAGILVVAFWPRISSFYRSTTGTLGELLAVQKAVAEKYQIPQPQVAVTVRRQAGVTGNILTVQLVNPSFLATTPDRDLPGKAREVARAVSDALPAGTTYPHYLIVFTKQKGVFFRSGTWTAYPFEEKDLPPREPHAAPPSR